MIEQYLCVVFCWVGGYEGEGCVCDGRQNSETIEVVWRMIEKNQQSMSLAAQIGMVWRAKYDRVETYKVCLYLGVGKVGKEVVCIDADKRMQRVSLAAQIGVVWMAKYDRMDS